MYKSFFEETEDIQTVRYIALIISGGHIEGYYKVEKAALTKVKDTDYPVRIKFDVANWVKLEFPAKFGMAKAAYRGFCKSRDDFFRHCREQAVL